MVIPTLVLPYCNLIMGLFRLRKGDLSFIQSPSSLRSNQSQRCLLLAHPSESEFLISQHLQKVS